MSDTLDKFMSCRREYVSSQQSISLSNQQPTLFKWHIDRDKQAWKQLAAESVNAHTPTYIYT